MYSKSAICNIDLVCSDFHLAAFHLVERDAHFTRCAHKIKMLETHALYVFFDLIKLIDVIHPRLFTAVH